jgi:hypothetical protein
MIKKQVSAAQKYISLFLDNFKLAIGKQATAKNVIDQG